jgi:hypothetical protein
MYYNELLNFRKNVILFLTFLPQPIIEIAMLPIVNVCFINKNERGFAPRSQVVLFAIFCYILLYFAILCYTLLYLAIPCYTLLYLAIPCYTLLYLAIPCYTFLYFAILCYTWLSFALLCYTLLYFAILCYTLQGRNHGKMLAATSGLVGRICSPWL